MLRTAFLVLSLCLIAAFVACGGDDNKVPDLGSGPAENVEGVWEGTYESGAGSTGAFCLSIDQDGRGLGGTIAFDGGPSTQITGAIAEDRMVFNWGQLATASISDAPPNISGSGTFSGNISAGTFDGTYSVTVSADSGTWSGHRSAQRSCG